MAAMQKLPKNWRILGPALALDTRARRVEVERAKGRGCLTRSVKLARVVRYFCFSAQKRLFGDCEDATPS